MASYALGYRAYKASVPPFCEGISSPDIAEAHTVNARYRLEDSVNGL